MKRRQSDRDAEAGLHGALMALMEMARRDPDCVCEPCRRLRELGRVLDAKSATPGVPFEMRPAPPLRPRHDRPLRVALLPPTERALRAAALQVAEARQARDDAIAAAFRSGAAIPDVARALGMDALDVRDVLVRAGVLEALQPKEAAARPARNR